MLDNSEVIREIIKAKEAFIGIKNELKDLKNKVRAYKGWTTRYRKKQKELEQKVIVLKNDNQLVRQDMAKANKKLNVKQQELLQAVAQAKQATEVRDRALLQLDGIIAKIEQYKEVCDRANKITYADKVYLIKEAEKLFFDEEIINYDFNLNSKDKPQMFTDPASINRSLLDN